MPDKHYQLQYGYMHCVGRTTYAAGTADTQAEALKWVKAQSVSKPCIRVPDEDPVQWCPVKHCHMKRQKPWFAFREVENSEPGVTN
jgi:hypothetical protein